MHGIICTFINVQLVKNAPTISSMQYIITYLKLISGKFFNGKHYYRKFHKGNILEYLKYYCTYQTLLVITINLLTYCMLVTQLKFS